VPEAGLEPAHHLWRRILSPVRLPIPPLRPAVMTCNARIIAAVRGQPGAAQMIA
jgi:hypothetical protein